MTIFIRVSPVVMVVAVVALVAGHLGGVSVAIGAVGIGIAVALVLAVAVGSFVVVRRVLAERESPRATVVRMPAEPGQLPGHARMLGAPQWRIPDDQIEQIAAEIRRQQARE